MNYLAHAYLSFENDEILLGNMISDFVKGKKQFNYPTTVHKGILLHRAIDEFTDFHPITKNAKSVFQADYRLYSGAFIDVAYDHFLATDEKVFSKGELFNFSQRTYNALSRQQAVMPATFKQMFFYMKHDNWLYGYHTKEGMAQSFGGLVKRAAYLHDSSRAIEIFDKQYAFLKNCFGEFWEELRSFAYNKYQTLITLSG